MPAGLGFRVIRNRALMGNSNSKQISIFSKGTPDQQKRYLATSIVMTYILLFTMDMQVFP
jgi:hypothetical protein